MYSVGIDLAWGARMPSGLCVLAQTGAETWRCELLTLVEYGPGEAPLLGALRPWLALDEPGFLAIDAPLVLHPERKAERMIARLLGRYKASAHAASASILGQYMPNGTPRGQALAELLAKRGFCHPGGAGLPPHLMFETYPHAILLGLFRSQLAAFHAPDKLLRLPYKHGPDKSRALSVVENCVENHLPVDWNGWLGRLPPRHKDREDLLDACICALAGLNLCIQQVPNVLLGRPETGYILTPLHPDDRPRLAPLPVTDWRLL